MPQFLVSLGLGGLECKVAGACYFQDIVWARGLELRVERLGFGGRVTKGLASIVQNLLMGVSKPGIKRPGDNNLIELIAALKLQDKGVKALIRLCSVLGGSEAVISEVVTRVG